MQHATGSPQQFCLRWNNYQTNLTNVFDQLFQNQSFVDVTLACDGRSIKAHRMILSACSPYFQSLLCDNPCKHPIVIMQNIKWSELRAVVEFMYKGEINVSQEQIGPLLKVAEALKIRGLADVNGEQDVVAPAVGEITKTTTANSNTPVDDGEAPLRPKKRRRASGERSNISSPAESAGATEVLLPEAPASVEMTPTPPSVTTSMSNAAVAAAAAAAAAAVTAASATAEQPLPLTLPLQTQQTAGNQTTTHQTEDMEIKPGIAEMIREEERAKLLESSHAWLGPSTSSIAADSYQYQLQSMWQKCWNTNQSLVHNLRFRERGPLKSWRPETMAEAIFSVLKEGLSLSQAARKYDIPYPTFVLYANRVHNMLGPSADGGSDLRPKGRGRPQRILLGVWPDEHIRGVIRAVVFRDSHQIKDEPPMSYQRMHDGISIQNYQNNSCTNGPESTVSPGAAAAAAVAAVAQGLRQQMCSMVAAAQQHQTSGHDTNPVANLVNSLALAQHCGAVTMPSNGAPPITMSHMRMSSPASSIQDLRISPSNSGMESPISSPLGLTVSGSMEPAINLGIGNSMEVGMGMTYKPANRSFTSPRPENLFQEDIDELVKPMHGASTPRPKDTAATTTPTIKMEPMAECRSE